MSEAKGMDIKMFKLLKKKTYLWISFFLLISMAATFFIVYQAYAALLTKDFMKKQSFLAMQATEILKEYLLSLDEQTSLLINKNQIPLKLAQKNYISLNNLHFDNNNFSRIEIYSTNKHVTSISTNTDSPSFESLPISEVKKILNNKETVWYTLSATEEEEVDTKLLYIQCITDEHNIVGYLSAWVNPDIIERILSLYTTTYVSSKDKLFSSYSAAVIQISDMFYQCGKLSVDIENIIKTNMDKTKILDKAYILQCELGIQDMLLIFLGDAEHFQSYLALIRKILIMVYIIISILIIIFLYLFTLKISSTVNMIYDKMKLEDPKEALE